MRHEFSQQVVDRFWTKVVKTAGCWEWNGMAGPNGYGKVAAGQRGYQLLAHRFSWMIHAGHIPSGLCVLHRCDNRRCVRPEHLFLGTQRDNLYDAIKKQRPGHPNLPQTHCRQRGHALDDAIVRNGRRWCRWCRKESRLRVELQKTIRAFQEGPGEIWFRNLTVRPIP